MFARISRSVERVSPVVVVVVVVVVFLTLVVSTTALATSGTWNVNATGAWSNTANWLGGTIADGAGSTANFSLVNLTNPSKVVTVDGGVASRTVGTLLIGDADAADNRSYTINNQAGNGTLTFNNLGADAVLTQISTSAGDFISVPVILADHLNVTNNSANALTFGLGITGAKNLTLNTASTGGIVLQLTTINNGGTITNLGSGTGTTAISTVIGTNVTGVVQNSATSQLTLSGNNTFTGGLSVKSGTLVGQTSPNALGAGLVTLGDTSGNADARILANGITLVRPITVGAGSSGTLSLGNVGSSNGVFSGAITLNNNLTLTSGGTGSTRLSGGISNTGNLTLNAAGSTSTVTIDTAGINHTGTITNVGTSTGNATLASVIGTNVTGVIQNSPTSQLTLSATNTFSSGVTVKSGTALALGNGAALGTGAVTLGDTSGTAAATLLSQNASHSNAINVIAGSSGTLTLGAINNSSSFTGPVSLANNLTLTSSGAGTVALTLSGGVTGTGNLTLNPTGTSTVSLTTNSVNPIGTITNQGTSTGTTVIGSVIGTNVIGVVQNSPTSQLTLSNVNPNTFSSGLTIKSGTALGLNNAAAFGTGTITLGDTSGTASATLLGQALTFSNAINVAAGSSGTLAIGNNGSTSAAFSGPVTLANNLTLTSVGTAAGSSNLSGAITGTGNITLNAAGSASIVTLSGVSTVNNVGTITNVGISSGNASISRPIGANVTGVIQTSPTSLLSLSGTNTAFAGGVTVKSGSVLATNASSLGTGTLTLGDSSGSASATMLSTFPAIPNPITVASGSAGTLSLSNSGNASAGYTGPITLNNNLRVTSAGTGSTTITGGITGTGNLLLDAAGTPSTLTLSTNLVNNAGTITNQGASSGNVTLSAALGSNVTSVIQNSSTSQLTISGVNTAFAGNVNAGSGTLVLGNNAATNANNIVAINSGAAVSAPNLDISHAGINDGGGGGGTWSGTSTLNRVLMLGGGGTYSFSGSISGTNRSLTVALTDSGSQTLAGANNYTGTTIVNSGTLLVNGSIGSGNVNVNGGTLGGTGSISGNVNVAAATLAPGASPGTLSIASLTLSGSSTTVIELGGATPGDGSGFYDQLNISGNATLAGTLTINTFGGVDISGGPYYILTRGSGTGTFAGLPEGSTVLIDGSFPGVITYNANWLGSQGASSLTGGNDVAIFNVVPEPGSIGALATAAMAMLIRRSRSRSRSRR